MDEQRKRVYGYRQRILDGANCKQLDPGDDRRADRSPSRASFSTKDYGTESFAEWAGEQLAVELDARDFRGTGLRDSRATAKDEAERMAESQVLDAIEENLPETRKTREWNWEALAKLANSAGG